MTPPPAYIITSCGKTKHPGPAPARYFYKGPFISTLNKVAAALRSRHGQLILSNKHGYMRPNHIIPGPYDSHWGYPDTMPDADLLRQIDTLNLRPGDYVVCLGAREYARQTRRLFPPGVKVIWPALHLTNKGMGHQQKMMNRWLLTRSIPNHCLTHCEFTRSMV